MASEATHRPLPAGVLIRASRAQIARAFPALVPLQPATWSARGLICAPRSAPERAAAALTHCPLPVEELDHPPGWPTPEAVMVAGWYRRSADHAPGPDPSRELVQTDGEGFGPLDHPTTRMCLAALDRLPSAPALDAGCGSGLLAQAWVKRTGEAVLAIDADPGAVTHARASASAAGLQEAIEVRQGQIDALGAADIGGRVILANIPSPAHHALLERTDARTPAVLLSGLTDADYAPVCDAWQARGMVETHHARQGRWHCIALVSR